MQQRQRELRRYVWSTYRGYAELEEEWPYVDYAALRALVEQDRKSDYAAYVEMGLASDDAQFAALYRRPRLSLGFHDFTAEERQAHQEVVRKAARLFWAWDRVSSQPPNRKVAGGRWPATVLARAQRRAGSKAWHP